MSSKQVRRKKGAETGTLPFSDDHYREIRRKNVIRLLLTYLLPLLVLSGFFYFQYNAIVADSRRLHLKAIAENQGNTLDLFLSERQVNLSNLIDDPKLEIPPSAAAMRGYLKKLQANSEAFVDVGYFDTGGIQVSYAGPYPALEKRDYSSEGWFLKLKDGARPFVITDIYLGFRQRPHFTIAVSRVIDDLFLVLRSTLDPEKIYEYIRSLEGSHEVYTSIVNQEGYYQLVTPHIGTPLETSSVAPPRRPRLGAEDVDIGGESLTYAYAWLKQADWALIVQWSADESGSLVTSFQFKLAAITAVIFIVFLVVIFYRADKLVEFQKESDRVRAQLEHAGKLASVGELAAGIAHEINNPLAAINEEAGLIKDLMDPAFGEPTDPTRLRSHLDSIQGLVFRCRDITHKLLGFVRRTEMNLALHDVHKLIDDVVDGLLGREMEVSNIEILRDYGQDIPEIVVDSNQFQQVILNMVNNGIDALMGHPGQISIATVKTGDSIGIEISDTGKGMTRDQMNRIFMPFFTTKEVGKGTGLGLSISYGIIKSLGGKIEVTSEVGQGTTFTITLPLR